MIIEKLEIQGVDDAIASMERLTAAINAASATMDALQSRGGNVRIKVCGQLAHIDIAQHFGMEGAVTPDSVAEMMRQKDRDG